MMAIWNVLHRSWVLGAGVVVALWGEPCIRSLSFVYPKSSSSYSPSRVNLKNLIAIQRMICLLQNKALTYNVQRCGKCDQTLFHKGLRTRIILTNSLNVITIAKILMCSSVSLTTRPALPAFVSCRA